MRCRLLGRADLAAVSVPGWEARQPDLRGECFFGASCEFPLLKGVTWNINALQIDDFLNEIVYSAMRI